MRNNIKSYPPEVELKKESASDPTYPLFILTLKLQYNKRKPNLFNKQESFHLKLLKHLSLEALFDDYNLLVLRYFLVFLAHHNGGE